MSEANLKRALRNMVKASIEKASGPQSPTNVTRGVYTLEEQRVAKAFKEALIKRISRSRPVVPKKGKKGVPKGR